MITALVGRLHVYRRSRSARIGWRSITTGRMRRRRYAPILLPRNRPSYGSSAASFCASTHAISPPCSNGTPGRRAPRSRRSCGASIARCSAPEPSCSSAPRTIVPPVRLWRRKRPGTMLEFSSSLLIPPLPGPVWLAPTGPPRARRCACALPSRPGAAPTRAEGKIKARAPARRSPHHDWPPQVHPHPVLAAATGARMRRFTRRDAGATRPPHPGNTLVSRGVLSCAPTSGHTGQERT